MQRLSITNKCCCQLEHRCPPPGVPSTVGRVPTTHPLCDRQGPWRHHLPRPIYPVWVQWRRRKEIDHPRIGRRFFWAVMASELIRI